MNRKRMKRMLRAWSGLAEQMVLCSVVIALMVGVLQGVLSDTLADIRSTVEMIILYCWLSAMINCMVFALTSGKLFLHLDISFGAGRKDSVYGVVWYQFLFAIQMIAFCMCTTMWLQMPLRATLSLLCVGFLVASAIGLGGTAVMMGSNVQAIVAYYICLGIVMFAIVGGSTWYGVYLYYENGVSLWQAAFRFWCRGDVQAVALALGLVLYVISLRALLRVVRHIEVRL